MKIELDINQLVELAKKYQEGKTSYTYPFFDAFEELHPVAADYIKGRLYNEFDGATL
jgi:hypothetical protein